MTSAFKDATGGCGGRSPSSESTGSPGGYSGVIPIIFFVLSPNLGGGEG